MTFNLTLKKVIHFLWFMLMKMSEELKSQSRVWFIWDRQFFFFFFCLIWGDMNGSFVHAIIIIDYVLHIGPWTEGHWGYSVWEGRYHFALLVH